MCLCLSVYVYMCVYVLMSVYESVCALVSVFMYVCVCIVSASPLLLRYRSVIGESLGSPIGWLSGLRVYGSVAVLMRILVF